MTITIYKKVGIASIVWMGSVFLSRIIGLVREIVIADFKGAGLAVDNYLVAFTLPEILNHLVASGFLSITFIPIFSKYLIQGRDEEGWKVFSTILTCSGMLLLGLIIVGETFTLPLLHLFAPGKTLPGEIAPILKMTRIILPAQFFFFAGGLFMAVQFAKERFFIPALSGLIYNIGIITGGLTLGRSMGMEGFAWGAFAGALVGNFLLQMIGARKVGMRFSPSFAFKHPDFRKYILLTIPLMIGLTPNFSIELLLRFFGSFLPDGGISSINYALRIMFIVVGLFGQAVATAFFPFMTRLVTENDMEAANRLLNRTLRYLALTLSIAMLLMVIRTEIVTVLFQRGAFDSEATALTARVLLFLMPTSVAMAAFAIVVRGYYAVQNTLFPAVFSTVAILLSLPLVLLWNACGRHPGYCRRHVALHRFSGTSALYRLEPANEKQWQSLNLFQLPQDGGFKCRYRYFARMDQMVFSGRPSTGRPIPEHRHDYLYMFDLVGTFNGRRFTVSSGRDQAADTGNLGGNPSSLFLKRAGKPIKEIWIKNHNYFFKVS